MPKGSSSSDEESSSMESSSMESSSMDSSCDLTPLYNGVIVRFNGCTWDTYANVYIKGANDNDLTEGLIYLAYGFGYVTGTDGNYLQLFITDDACCGE